MAGRLHSAKNRFSSSLPHVFGGNPVTGSCCACGQGAKGSGLPLVRPLACLLCACLKGSKGVGVTS